MPRKDTKLQKLSESIQYTIDEMRGLGIEGLDQLFLEIYMEEAEQLTDSRQQAKVKHSIKDVIGIVFLLFWQEMMNGQISMIFLWMKGMFWKSIWNCQMGFLPMTPYKDFSLS